MSRSSQWDQPRRLQPATSAYALAAWTARPTSADPAQISAAEAHCAPSVGDVGATQPAASDKQGPRPAGGPWSPVLVDSRGDLTLALYSGDGTATTACLAGPSFVWLNPIDTSSEPPVSDNTASLDEVTIRGAAGDVYAIAVGRSRLCRNRSRATTCGRFGSKRHRQRRALPRLVAPKRRRQGTLGHHQRWNQGLPGRPALRPVRLTANQQDSPLVVRPAEQQSPLTARNDPPGRPPTTPFVGARVEQGTTTPWTTIAPAPRRPGNVGNDQASTPVSPCSGCWSSGCWPPPAGAPPRTTERRAQRVPAPPPAPPRRPPAPPDRARRDRRTRPRSCIETEHPAEACGPSARLNCKEPDDKVAMLYQVAVDPILSVGLREEAFEGVSDVLAASDLLADNRCVEDGSRPEPGVAIGVDANPPRRRAASAGGGRAGLDGQRPSQRARFRPSPDGAGRNLGRQTPLDMRFSRMAQQHPLWAVGESPPPGTTAGRGRQLLR